MDEKLLTGIAKEGHRNAPITYVEMLHFLPLSEVSRYSDYVTRARTRAMIRIYMLFSL